MKKMLVGTLLMFVVTLCWAQQRVVWKIVWPAGNVLEAQYFSLSSCQDALKYAPDGSTCVAFQK